MPDEGETKKVNRKMKILAVAANEGGCAYYRILMPMRKLAEKFSGEVEIRFNQNPLCYNEKEKKYDEEPDLSDIEWADIVFTQNIPNYGAPYLFKLVQVLKEKGKFFHYDTDDLLTDLYEGHRLWNLYKENKLDELTQFVYSNADLVTVTQRKFAERIAPYCNRTLAVMKNAIDYDLPCWNAPWTPRKKGPMRIGWVGGIHHEQDLKQVPTMAMGVNIKAGPENVEWKFFGRPPLQPGEKGDWQQDVWDNYTKLLTAGIKHRNFGVFNAMPSFQYGYMFTQMDVGIAPLEWNNFNDSKSDIKVAECGRYGLPLVATDCGAYDELIINGETGYLIDKTNPRSEWVARLSKLAKDPKGCREMGLNLKSVTDELYDINKQVVHRLNLYKQLLVQHGFWEDV